MAIWYWQMDQLHSLTLSHQVTRFNVLLAHIAVSSPCAEQDLGSGLYHFLTNFVMAWLDAALGVKHGEDLTRDYFITRVWKKGMYDLVRWRPMQISRMKAAVKKLETVVPECTVSGEQFWEEVVNRPVEEHRKHGRVWAMQYIIYMERKAEGFKKDDQLRQADENLSSGDFAGAFAGLGVGDEAPDCLSEELFEREEVKALLVDVEDVMVQQPEENVPWMDPSAAIDVLEGNIDGVGDLMRTMESSFLIM
ncbi:hypothetical protein PtrSN002B_005610 [Pyrenophora tritici-repentis]|nr:hypothetical protein PtrV1_04538 [Pyrenophora tritici-repentis]KAF7574653.1 hypothetical protein PtrM4_062770 [Pyrenophora tritici-repentis]KAI0579055.1 hypothetical protein Alg215_05998 [Pyrenophora tritici-repentis]KAI0584782.1 hypothetical protein Alg130_05066 [Pyrenophora tritici-repentis]KAI0610629.1 hypothetical protein TUN205_05119 [Pyrenophora tritici-repentis]